MMVKTISLLFCVLGGFVFLHDERRTAPRQRKTTKPKSKLVKLGEGEKGVGE